MGEGGGLEAKEATGGGGRGGASAWIPVGGGEPSDEVSCGGVEGGWCITGDNDRGSPEDQGQDPVEV